MGASQDEQITIKLSSNDSPLLHTLQLSSSPLEIIIVRNN